MQNDAPTTFDSNGHAHLPTQILPLSNYMSDEAKRRFIDLFVTRIFPEINTSTDILKARKELDKYVFSPLLERIKTYFPVSTHQAYFGSVRTDIVIPQEGAAPDNVDRVLINLHGGGFVFGAAMNGLIESIPIAYLTKTKVVSIDYRQAPEHEFPVATEDVVAVYNQLLKRYPSQNIAIYGSSAGGWLTAMVTSWLIKNNLPLPGAIGIISASADVQAGGDSSFISHPLTGSAPPPPSPNPPNPPYPQNYLQNADTKDPLVSPVVSEHILAQFPPTILITGTRSWDLSSTVYTHAKLVDAGVDAQLHVWDGMWHGFIYEADLPESSQAFRAIARFFKKHLHLDNEPR